MADESDGINEALGGALRVSLTVAGQLAERVARAREQTLRNAQAASEREARELQGRLDAERSAARAALAPVGREEWWQRARPAEIAQAWETAHAWREIDPDARHAGDRIRDRLRSRYAIDVQDLRADPDAVRAALAQRERAGQGGEHDRTRARAEKAEADLVMADAARADRDRGGGDAQRVQADAAHDGAEAVYDSAERRDALATQLEVTGEPDAVQARVLADANQARPAQDAVAAGAARSPRARRARGAGARVKDRSRAR